MSPELQQLRDEIEAVVLDLLCPTSCGYRISSGGMTVDATNRMTSFYKQGGPCSVHVSMARAIAQRILPIVEHPGTDLEAATEICGLSGNYGAHMEPLACAYPKDHDGPHAWTSLPTFVNGFPCELPQLRALVAERTSPDA